LSKKRASELRILAHSVMVLWLGGWAKPALQSAIGLAAELKEATHHQLQQTERKIWTDCDSEKTNTPCMPAVPSFSDFRIQTVPSMHAWFTRLLRMISYINRCILHQVVKSLPSRARKYTVIIHLQHAKKRERSILNRLAVTYKVRTQKEKGIKQIVCSSITALKNDHNI